MAAKLLWHLCSFCSGDGWGFLGWTQTCVCVMCVCILAEWYNCCRGTKEKCLNFNVCTFDICWLKRCSLIVWVSNKFPPRVILVKLISFLIFCTFLCVLNIFYCLFKQKSPSCLRTTPKRRGRSWRRRSRPFRTALQSSTTWRNSTRYNQQPVILEILFSSRKPSVWRHPPLPPRLWRTCAPMKYLPSYTSNCELCVRTTSRHKLISLENILSFQLVWEYR